MANFTGDFRYGCGTINPYHYCVPLKTDGSPLYHSYGYQSVLSLNDPPRQVMSVICNPNTCYQASSYEFVRLCYPPWHASWEGPSQLNCHDQDGTSFTVAARNDSPVGAIVRGHPFY
jgi:hypothetical protein